MTYSQVVKPNPNIPSEPGWCLQYVRQAFGAPAVEPTATAGWNNAKKKHVNDWDIPLGIAVPVWFSLAYEPAGHVALRMPDRSIYSTTHPTNKFPTRHANMAELLAAYEPYNPLTYLGWSEDISGVTVVEPFSLNTQSEEINMAVVLEPEHAEAIAKRAAEIVLEKIVGKLDHAIRIDRVQAEAIAARAAYLTLEKMPNISNDVLVDLKKKIESLNIVVEVK